MAELGEEHRPPPALVDDCDTDPENIVSVGQISATEGVDHDEDIFSATDEDFEDHEIQNGNHNNLFYDENLDEEDETYVYKHLRSGIREPADLRAKSNNLSRTIAASGKVHFHDNVVDGAASDDDDRRRAALVFKPRHSDAVLSCPCCFNIVCMDCQKHKRYANQYRAMFVMGVVVDWNHILVYDNLRRALISKVEPDVVEEEPLPCGEGHILRAKKGEYYAVECASCRTRVAALDMTDEVYHFYGCLESSTAF